MRGVLQRVSRAEVRVQGRVVGSVGRGLLVLLAVERADTEAEADWMARKVAELRIFPDAEGKMNLSVVEAGGGALAVSQFTLAARIHKGRRPSFDRAEEPARASALFDRFVKQLEGRGVPVATGSFGAMMEVDLVNDGPVTLVLDRGPGVGAGGE